MAVAAGRDRAPLWRAGARWSARLGASSAVASRSASYSHRECTCSRRGGGAGAPRAARAAGSRSVKSTRAYLERHHVSLYALIALCIEARRLRRSRASRAPPAPPSAQTGRDGREERADRAGGVGRVRRVDVVGVDVDDLGVRRAGSSWSIEARMRSRSSIGSRIMANRGSKEGKTSSTASRSRVASM